MTTPPDMPTPARILIVDDEPLNVDYLEQELECRGFVTDTASNGLEALERVAASPPDLVLLDVMMPELDGISTLQILKADEETRLIPVVVMTALNAVEDRVRGIEAGADDFLSKPVDDRELIARIRTSLTVKRAIDETVAELRSTSDHLERFGQQERDVAVLAVAWRLQDESLPGEAVAFLGRRHKVAAGDRIRALGGQPTATGDDLLVAVFDGADVRTRSTAAVEAADAIVAEGAGSVAAAAAIAVGLTRVGSIRAQTSDDARWVFGAEGAPVEEASGLARQAAEAGVVVAGDAAAALSETYVLESVGGGAYRVVGPATPRQADRWISTILVTDIVNSTKKVEELGDHAWGELAAAHEHAVREVLGLRGGEEIDTTGDGFFVSFDSAARAIECALEIQSRIRELGLTIRAGIHTGEVERVGGSIRGIAVHLASRIADRAEPDELLVSATTRELAAGSGLTFVDRGEHAFKGVSGRRALYSVDR
jgi:DNA-binding response OmpR family regulator/class 3 adenylate cyclase